MLLSIAFSATLPTVGRCMMPRTASKTPGVVVGETCGCEHCYSKNGCSKDHIKILDLHTTSEARLAIGEYLGSGGFADTYRGKLSTKSTDFDVAVKFEFQTDWENQKTEFDSYGELQKNMPSKSREMDVLEKLGEAASEDGRLLQFIPRYYGWGYASKCHKKVDMHKCHKTGDVTKKVTEWTTYQRFSIMSYCPGFHLKAYYGTNEHGRRYTTITGLQSHEKKMAAELLVDALISLWTNGIAHGDIGVNNMKFHRVGLILMLKFLDFGESKELTWDEVIETNPDNVHRGYDRISWVKDIRSDLESLSYLFRHIGLHRDEYAVHANISRLANTEVWDDEIIEDLYSVELDGDGTSEIIESKCSVCERTITYKIVHDHTNENDPQEICYVYDHGTFKKHPTYHKKLCPYFLEDERHVKQLFQARVPELE